MANMTPSRMGFINQTSDASWAQDNAMFLKVFAGEVLTAFRTATVALPLTRVRTISSGHSAQFPVSWKASAAYHTPGTQLAGTQKIKHNEKVIKIDDLLVADAFIANLEEAKNHYDVRSIYTTELGQALARTIDKNLLRLAALAARASSNFSGGDGYGGTQLTNAGYDTTADTLVQGIYDAAQALDEKDVPEEGRVCIVKPKHYNLIVQSTKALNRDWNPNGNNGSIASGKVLSIAGISIIKSNQLPTDNYAGTTGEQNTYAVNCTNTVGLVFHRDAVATVKLMDMAMESQYLIEYQGTFFVAKYAMGSGILRPEAAVELLKA